jgi:hypothetical protein
MSTFLSPPQIECYSGGLNTTGLRGRRRSSGLHPPPSLPQDLFAGIRDNARASLQAFASSSSRNNNTSGHGATTPVHAGESAIADEDEDVSSLSSKPSYEDTTPITEVSRTSSSSDSHYQSDKHYNRYKYSNPPSPLSTAHVSDSSTVVATPRFGISPPGSPGENGRLDYLDMPFRNGLSMPKSASAACVIDVGTSTAAATAKNSTKKESGENLRIIKIRVVCTCFMYFLLGWGDGCMFFCCSFVSAISFECLFFSDRSRSSV